MGDSSFVISEQQAVEFLAFLVTSARGLVDEPQDYGTMRLLDAAERFSHLMLPQASGGVAALLKMLSDETPAWQGERRHDPEGYVAFMDECCRAVARELKRQDAEGKAGHD